MYKTVGRYIPESRDQPEVIEREYYGQGMIYKNWEAYYDTAYPDQVCYIPELSDSLYTRQDFLDICNGQPEIADRIFEEVDWQSPETCLEDQWYEELAICPDCKKWYWCYDVEKCPNCGNVKEHEMDQKTELYQKYIDILENLGWSVSSYTGDGRVEIEKYSPAGEDFIICVDAADFPKSVFEYAENFDVDEHIAMWIEGKENGTAGVPSTRELVCDAEEIEKMLQELSDALNNLETPNKTTCDAEENKWNCEVNLNVIVTEEDIDDIMVSALEGGITYWCREAEVIGERLGEGWGHEQIARGGILRLYDAEDGGYYDLNREKFLSGLKKYLEHPLYDGMILRGIHEDRMELDCGMIDAPAADQIIQYALFGEIMYA